MREQEAGACIPALASTCVSALPPSVRLHQHLTALRCGASCYWRQGPSLLAHSLSIAEGCFHGPIAVMQAPAPGGVKERERQHESKPRSVSGLHLHRPHYCSYGKLPPGPPAVAGGRRGVLPFRGGTFCLAARGLSPGEVINAHAKCP